MTFDTKYFTNPIQSWGEAEPSSQVLRSYSDMKKDDSECQDDLRSEYDLKSLRVRRLGPGRKSFGHDLVRLEPDVAELFPNADAVNEALRFLARVTRENKAS
jgi:hypothetical protein